jgi:uncharacterized protein with HEPN domain
MPKILIVSFETDEEADYFVSWQQFQSSVVGRMTVIGEVVMDHCSNDNLGEEVYRVVSHA